MGNCPRSHGLGWMRELRGVIDGCFGYPTYFPHRLGIFVLPRPAKSASSDNGPGTRRRRDRVLRRCTSSARSARCATTCCSTRFLDESRPSADYRYRTSKKNDGSKSSITWKERYVVHENGVPRIGTFGTPPPNAAIKDTGRGPRHSRCHAVNHHRDGFPMN